MWCCRKMEKISWTYCVKNEEVLRRVKEERNTLHTVKRRKTNLIGHILRRNCFLKDVIEGKLEGRVKETERRGRRCKQLLDDLNEKRGYYKLKDWPLECTLWGTWFGRAYGSVVRQRNEWIGRFQYFNCKVTFTLQKGPVSLSEECLAQFVLSTSPHFAAWPWLSY